MFLTICILDSPITIPIPNLADSLQRQPLVTQVLNDNDEIVTTDLQEENMQIINKLYLETIAKGIREWEEEQIEVLDNLRQQCPLAGGEAVYKARSLYARLYPGQWLYDDESICAVNDMAWRQAQITVSANPFVKTYPNPATDNITFEWGNLGGEEANIQVYDAKGALILSHLHTADAQKWQCNIKTWSKGIYACTISTATHTVTTKFIVE